MSRMTLEAPPDARVSLDALADAKPEAFHQFFDHWFPRVHAFALGHARDRARAEDATARALTRALDEICAGARPPDLGRFLFALVREEISRSG